jgi:hypothetical protein
VKRLGIVLAALAMVVGLGGCWGDTAAKTASENVS